MKNLFVFILFALTVCCGETEQVAPPPANLISTKEMEVILRDMCKIEARFQRRLSSKNTKHIDMALANYASVFAKHGITEDQFKTSYNYYSDHPDVMQTMYDSVIVNLTKEQAELKKVQNNN